MNDFLFKIGSDFFNFSAHAVEKLRPVHPKFLLAASRAALLLAASSSLKSLLIVAIFLKQELFYLICKDYKDNLSGIDQFLMSMLFNPCLAKWKRP